MNDGGFSSDDERWPLMAVLTWIATRSLKSAEKLAFCDPVEADKFLFETRKVFGAPGQISYSASFYSLNEKIESRAIVGAGSKIKWTVAPADEQLPIEKCFSLAKVSEVFEACAFRPQELSNANRGAGYMLTLEDFTFHDRDCFTPKGSGCGCPNPDGSRERWTWKAVTFAREGVLRVWVDWPVYSAWKLARARGWEPPRGISADWLKNLPPGQYVPFADVVDLLAFGRAKMSIGLSDIDEHAAQLRAGIAIINAAIEGKVELVVIPCERLQTHPHLLRQTGHRIAIGSETLHDLIPVPFGGRDWLGPRRYADEYPEIGHAPQSVSFYDVRVERALFLKWLTEVSTKAPGLSESDVTNLIRREKETNPFVSIDKIVKTVQSQDPLFSREWIREIARELGVKGRRGPPRKNSAE